jgi:Animal haem peroxidase
MFVHGESTSTNTRKLSDAARQIKRNSEADKPYRNFGLNSYADEKLLYSALPDAGDSERMFAKLMQRMALPFTYADGTTTNDLKNPVNENPTIPAGYTYFAQLVGHDLSQSNAFPSKLSKRKIKDRNERRTSLSLETIYGRGPLRDPAFYELPRDGEHFRTRLRTAAVDTATVDSKHPEPAGCPYHNRELPRMLQTDLSDFNGKSVFGRPDVLIPDARNDDSPMLSQLTVLFHQLHNAVIERVKALDPQFDELDPDPADINRFEMARALVARCYRKMIVTDLLPKLLNASVYNSYQSAGFAPIMENKDIGNFDDEPIALEFSHAAYRACHSMVRSRYQFNDAHIAQGLIPSLQRSSSKLERFLPLRLNWVSQWSRFFDFTKSGKPAPQMARKFGPSYNEVLQKASKFQTKTDTNDVDPQHSGLLFRDFNRGTLAGLLRLDKLVDLVSKKFKLTPLQADKVQRAKLIRDWLTIAPGVFNEAELKSLSENPPLLFWILFEAAQQENGKSLGMIGSIIVAETVCVGLDDTIELPKSNFSESTIENFVFFESMPDTMPKMIEYVSRVLKLDDVTPRFV